MNVSEKDFDLVIARILSGEADADDAIAFGTWWEQNAKNQQRFQQINAWWNRAEDGNMEKKTDAALKEIGERLFPVTEIRSVRKRRYLPIAASFLMFLGGTVFFLLSHSGDKQTGQKEYTYVCSKGHYQLVMSEGSIIHMNELSTITYRDRYGEQNREITLDGEAWFDVKKSEHPFVVHVGNASIRALGTCFNVQSYKNGSQVIVTQEEGMAEFRIGTRTEIIRSNQQLVFDKISQKNYIHEVDAKTYSAWKENIYRYRGVTLQTLCQELGKQFDVEIDLAPELREMKVSGSFEYRQDIDHIFLVMQKRIPFDWTREGNKIQMFGK